MRLTWLGCASLVIEEAGERIAFDPYYRRRAGALPPFPMDALRDVRACFITHPHLDHFSDIAEVLEVCPASVFVCPRGIEIARREGIPQERLVPTAPGDTWAGEHLAVRAWRAEHCVFDAPLIASTLVRALHPANLRGALALVGLNHRFSIDYRRDVLAFEVRGAQTSVLVLGSAALADDVAYPAADTLVFPYQGRHDMARWAVPIIRRLGARRVVLDHFDDAFPPVSCAQDTGRLVALAHRELPGVAIVVPHLGEPVEL